MEAPLRGCTIEEQRAVVRFLWAEGVKPGEIHRRMLAQYGHSTMNQRKVYEWVKRFKAGRTGITDEGRSGRPSTSRTKEHISRADALIRQDRQITVAQLAARLDISYGSAFSILHDNLGYRNVGAQWVPKHGQEDTQVLRRYGEGPERTPSPEGHQ